MIAWAVELFCPESYEPHTKKWVISAEKFPVNSNKVELSNPRYYDSYDN